MVIVLLERSCCGCQRKMSFARSAYFLNNSSSDSPLFICCAGVIGRGCAYICKSGCDILLSFIISSSKFSLKLCVDWKYCWLFSSTFESMLSRPAEVGMYKSCEKYCCSGLATCTLACSRRIAFTVVKLYSSLWSIFWSGNVPHCGDTGDWLRWPGLAKFCCCASRRICCPMVTDPWLVILTVPPVCRCAP